MHPFPASGAVYQLSKDDDGHHPWWSHDGRGLSYVPGPDGLTRVSVSTRPSFSLGSPMALPRAGRFESPVASPSIDGAPDGERIVGVVSADQVASGGTNASKMAVVINWFEELKRLAPTKTLTKISTLNIVLQVLASARSTARPCVPDR